MKIRLLLLNCLCFSVFNVLTAAHSSCIQTNGSVIVFTDPVFTDTPNAAQPEVISIEGRIFQSPVFDDGPYHCIIAQTFRI